MLKKTKKFREIEKQRRALIDSIGLSVESVVFCPTLVTQCYFGSKGDNQIAVLFTTTYSMNPLIYDYSKTENQQTIADVFKRNYEDNRKQDRGLKVNDVLYASWGYEQTNINFYQVVRLAGKASVVLREINQCKVFNDYMGGKATPILNDFKGDEFTKRVRPDGTTVSVDHSCAWFLEVDPTTKKHKHKSFTSYA